MKRESPGIVLWRMRQRLLHQAQAKGWTAAQVDEWAVAMFGVPVHQLQRRYVEAMLIHLSQVPKAEER